MGVFEYERVQRVELGFFSVMYRSCVLSVILVGIGSSSSIFGYIFFGSHRRVSFSVLWVGFCYLRV